MLPPACVCVCVCRGGRVADVWYEPDDQVNDVQEQKGGEERGEWGAEERLAFFAAAWLGACIHPCQSPSRDRTGRT
jgi:hypothetical protein